MQQVKEGGFDYSRSLEVVRKNHSPQLQNVWYMLGLPLILSAGALVAWGKLIFPPKALPMICLTGFAYLSVWVSQNKTDDYRAYKVLSFSAFYLSIAYILILGIIAFTRAYYSRSFLISTYGLFVIWNVASVFFINSQAKKLLVIMGGIADQLKNVSNHSWSFVNSLSKVDNISVYEGIVVDLHVDHKESLLTSLASKSLQGIPIIHAATVYEEYTGRTSIEYLAHEGLYKLGMSRGYEYLKRFWEVALVATISVLIFPFIILIALGIKLDSRGPILFKQRRVGKSGKSFVLYKFRSMKTGAEKSGASFATENDDRITKFGRFIRKFRLDELPQFWNVLKGDMNLIGPRPEQEHFVKFFEEEIPFYAYRHKVRPGITGWAQIKGGYASDLEATREKLEYDFYYVKNLSLSLDLLVVYATLKTIFTGFGSR